MNKTTAITVLLIIASAIIAGCVENEKTIKTSEGDVKVSEGSSGPDWCKAGTSVTSVTSSQQGQYSFVIKGLTTYKGQEVCEADATFDNAGQSESVTYYFSKDNKYAHIIMKDASGNIINEMNTSNS